jgi:hypothetical protein
MAAGRSTDASFPSLGAAACTGETSTISFSGPGNVRDGLRSCNSKRLRYSAGTEGHCHILTLHRNMSMIPQIFARLHLFGRFHQLGKRQTTWTFNGQTHSHRARR